MPKSETNCLVMQMFQSYCIVCKVLSCISRIIYNYMQYCHMQSDISHAPHIKKKKTIVRTVALILVYLFIDMINVEPTMAESNKKTFSTSKGTRCSELFSYINTHYLLFVKFYQYCLF